jgi:two-component system chemotaxis response regulator CheY
MKQVLIADDSSVIRKVARRLLEDLDYVTIEAPDGADALEQCGASMPDVIVVDWKLPHTNGVCFLRALRELPDGDKPLVVFCAAEHDPAHIAQAMEAGADDYLLKPFDKTTFREKFEKYADPRITR